MNTVELCNAALARLGEARIASLDETHLAARTCAQLYPVAVDELLRSHRWNFASSRAVLSRLDETPVFGFRYAYQLPGDCMRVVEVNGVSSTGTPSEAWEIEGRKLLTDAETARIVYIYRATNLDLWDSLALECLTLLLASKLAPVIQGGSTSKENELLEALNRLTAPLARRIDANESRRPSESPMEQMLRGSRAIAARRCDV